MTLEREANRLKTANKGYLFDLLLPWQLSGICSYQQKINPWCVVNLHGKCQELKPKVQSNRSFLVLHLSLGVVTINAVGSHLKFTLKSLAILAIWLALSSVIYWQIILFLCFKLYLFLSQWEWDSKSRQKDIVGQILHLPGYHSQNFVVVVFFKKIDKLVDYSFWMAIMSSFKLKTYFKGGFQLSVSILTNILAIFLQHLQKVCIISSSGTQKPHNNKLRATSRRSMSPGFCYFQTNQYKGSVAVNKQSQNTPCSTKQWYSG